MKNSKNSLKQIIIDLGIFRTELLVLISEDKHHVARALAHQHGEKEHANFSWRNCDAACFYMDGKFPILWIQKYPQTPKEYGTLVHEACHITTYVLEECAIRTNHDDGETYSYLTEYIVEQILLKKEFKFSKDFYTKNGKL